MGVGGGDDLADSPEVPLGDSSFGICACQCAEFSAGFVNLVQGCAGSGDERGRVAGRLLGLFPPLDFSAKIPRYLECKGPGVS